MRRNTRKLQIANQSTTANNEIQHDSQGDHVGNMVATPGPVRTSAFEMQLENEISTNRSVAWSDYRQKNLYFFYNILMLAFGTICVLPIRLILLFIVGSICLFINFLLKFVFKLDPKIDYFDIERKPLFHGSWCKRLFFWLVYYGWRLFVFSCGGWYLKVVNPENVDKSTKTVIVAPHISAAGTDCIPGKIMAGRFPFYMSRISNKCPYFDVLDFLYVDRNNPSSKRNIVKSQLYRLASKDWDESVQIIFPEGTTGSGRVLQHFSKGAFLAGKAVQPVAIEFPCAVSLLFRKLKSLSKYLNQFRDKVSPCILSPDMVPVLPFGRFFERFLAKDGSDGTEGSQAAQKLQQQPVPRSALIEKPPLDDYHLRNAVRGAGWCAWTSETNTWLLLWYNFIVFWQPIIFTVLPTYHPSDEEKRDPNLYAQNVRAVMARAAGVKLTDQNRIDSFVLVHLNQKFGVCKSPEVADKIFVDGGLLEEEFGSKICDTREICKWSEEWFSGGMKGSCRNFVRNKLKEKLAKRE